MKNLSTFLAYSKKKAEYASQGCEMPLEEEQLYIIIKKIEYILDVLDKAATNQALSEECRNLFNGINSLEINDIISKDLADYYHECINELASLRDDLSADPRQYFYINSTLSREGRKRIRKTQDSISQNHYRKIISNNS